MSENDGGSDGHCSRGLVWQIWWLGTVVAMVVTAEGAPQVLCAQAEE